MRRPQVRPLLAISLLVASLGAPVAIAAQDHATPVAAAEAPLILAAVSGWNPDAAASEAADGRLPVLGALLEQGSGGEMRSPGSIGPALTTLLTGAWPAEHGVVSETFFRTGAPAFSDSASWTDPSIVQADTLMLAAERAGKTVVTVGWPGSETAALEGPVIGEAATFSLPGVARSSGSDAEVTAAIASGADLNVLAFAPATDWANIPQSYSAAQEATFVVETLAETVNPDQALHVLALDSSDDGIANYDQLVVSPVKDAAPTEPISEGDWSSVPVTLGGELEGASAGLHYKVLELAPDLSNVEIYYTPVGRLSASWAGCVGVAACEAEGGFAESVSRRLGPVLAADDAALHAGLIDDATLAEQTAARLAQAQAAITYLTGELGLRPDLLLLGADLAPTAAPARAVGTPVASGDVSPTGAHAALDALLGSAQTAMGGEANLILAAHGAGVTTTRAVDAGVVLAAAGLAEGAQPDNCVAAPVTTPDGTPDPEALPVGPRVKACWDGQFAHLYINLDGREAMGTVPEDDYDALVDQIVAAFSDLQDPAAADVPVVAGAVRKDGARDIDGTDLLHPSRTGDVVITLREPYRFDNNANGEPIAAAVTEIAAPAVATGALNMAGPAVATGVVLDAAAIDVAPTSAMMLGIPGPYNASGNLLLEAMAGRASLRDITILDISDFHGQLPPLSASADTIDADGAVSTSYPVGGVAVLDSWFDLYRSNARGPVLLLAAGDSVGATPPISTAFGDKPTIEMMNAMGFTADALGNHNFDVSSEYMFTELGPLAEFPFLSVNLVPAREDVTPAAGDPPYLPSLLLDLDGAKIGLIGFSNPDIPRLTRPGALDPYRVIDPVQPITDEAASLRQQGAAAIVAFGHMGALGGTLTEPTGPVVDVADAVDGVDVVIADHTDVQVSALRQNGVMLVENRSKGVMFTRVNLVVDVDTGELVYMTTDFHRPWVSGMTPDPEIAAQLEALEAELAPTLGQVIGSGAMSIPRSDSCGMETGRTCESLIGNVLTDAMRTSYNTDFALTNSGGIRAALTCPLEGGDFCPTDQGANLISQGQVLNVLPFGNVAVTLEISGAELKEMLETGVASMPVPSGAFPQVSGFCFTYDISREAGDRVTGAVRQATDGSCSGEAIDLGETASYTLTTNDFTASGGDGYPDLLSRANSRDVLANVLVESISETSALALPGEALNPQLQGRITCEGEGCPETLP